MDQLHVLMLPSWYPTPTAPLAGTFFREQAQALREAGVHLGVVYPDMRSMRTMVRGGWSANCFKTTGDDEGGIPTFRYHGWALPKLPRWSSALWISNAVALTERYVAQHGRPQVVHAQATCWAGVAARAISQKWCLPYVLTEHSSDYARGLIGGWRRPRVVAALRDAARLMAVSPALAAAMRPLAGGRPIEIVPNFVDTTFFTLPDRPRRAPPFRFLTVALLHPKKGVATALRAFAAAFRGRRDVVLEIGGDGPQRPELEGLARSLGVREQVVFLGMLDRIQVREAMWRAHSYVLASPKETFGIAMVEAMATGTSVIATRSGGPDDLVAPGLGWLVPPADPDALSAAMVACCEDGPRTPVQERASHDHVTAQFSAAQFSRQVTRIYRDAVATGADDAAVVERSRRALV